MIRPVRIYESITMLRFGEIGVVGNTADSSTWFSGTKPSFADPVFDVLLQKLGVKLLVDVEQAVDPA
jgi:hypothetical protein